MYNEHLVGTYWKIFFFGLNLIIKSKAKKMKRDWNKNVFMHGVEIDKKNRFNINNFICFGKGS